MISVFLLALVLLLMCSASFIVGVAITYGALKHQVVEILKEDNLHVTKLERIEKLITK